MHTLKTLLIALVVLVAPLPVGGYEAWLLPLITALAGIALLIELAHSRHRAPASDTVAWAVLWMIAAGYALLQSLLIHQFRDITFYVPHATAGQGLGVLDVGAALIFHVRLVVYGAVAFTVSRMSRREINVVLCAVVLAAAFQSLYGLANFARGNPSILGIWPPGMHLDSVMGTFYSRNQLAGYLAAALPIGLAWLWRCRQGTEPHTGARALLMVAAILYVMITAVALIGSGSRLGVTAAIAGLLLWGWLAVRRRSEAISPATTRLATGLLVLLALVSILWFGPDVILSRFFQLSVADARFAIWAAMLDIPFNVWLWGIGPGQFIDVFKLYQDATISDVYWRALNDYLQFTLEYGLVGTTLLALVTLWWLKHTWPHHTTAYRHAALAGLTAILIHSLGDFDLRVPGTAILFWTLLGTTLRPK